MIVDNTKEYYQQLFKIDNTNSPPSLALLLPSSEKIYQIDLNTRTIEQPSEQTIIVGDHNSETIYFSIPRYYDNMDLSTVPCVIQYIAADKKQYIYPVPYYDIDTLAGKYEEIDPDTHTSFFIEEPKMILPWCLAGTAAAQAGTVTFAFKFFKFNGETEIIYNLNTLPQTITINNGIGKIPEDIYTDTEVSLTEQSYLKFFETAKETADSGALTWMVLE